MKKIQKGFPKHFGVHFEKVLLG